MTGPAISNGPSLTSVAPDRSRAVIRMRASGVVGPVTCQSSLPSFGVASKIVSLEVPGDGLGGAGEPPLAPVRAGHRDLGRDDPERAVTLVRRPGHVYRG